MGEPGVTNVAVQMPRELRDALRDRARAEDLTLSQLLRRLARRYLEDRKETP